jgi:uncharacterized protein (DUF433 family)
MAASSANLLGIGLYTPAEAALYARVSTQLLNRWLFGSASGEPVLNPELADRSERLVTFLDFVQALAVRAVRVSHKVPLPKIRAAIDCAEREYGLSYPFARKHTTYLFGSDIIIKLRDEGYVQVSGKGARNRMITKVAEFYMQDISYGEEGLATAFRAFSWKQYAVDMNPHVRFGEPLIESCGYSARALWEAVTSEGSIEAAAQAYGVKVEEVETACRYYDYLASVAAA